MIISVMNHSDIPNADVEQVIRAINRQIADDFAPYWSITARLRLERTGTGRRSARDLLDLRGDAVIYLWDRLTQDPGGYHNANYRGIPSGFVYPRLPEMVGARTRSDDSSADWLHWSVALSHETLELIADPELNLLVRGPHPAAKRHVFHCYEVCDPVQGDTYAIDGVRVSNFVLPRYFASETHPAGRNDFLGTGLKAFRWNPQGYICFWDPHQGRHGAWVDYPIKKAATTRKRLKALGKVARAARYRAHGP